MTLQSLSQLRTLILHDVYFYYTAATVESSGMNDECMKQLTAHLKHLQKLSFGFKGGLTIQSIIAIAIYCPKLRELEMVATYDLQALIDVDEILFPNLVKLFLRDAGVKDLQDKYVPSHLNSLHLHNRIFLFPHLA